MALALNKITHEGWYAIKQRNLKWLLLTMKVDMLLNKETLNGTTTLLFFFYKDGFGIK